MNRVVLPSLLFLAFFIGACNGNKPVQPDYSISGEMPHDIKVLQGQAVVAFRVVRVYNHILINIPSPNLVTLASGPQAAGITVNFQGANAGRPNFNASIAVNVANTVAAGSYPVSITGTAAGIPQKNVSTHTVRVFGPADGGAYIEVIPSSELTIRPGEGKSIIARVTRIPPFVGNVTVTFPGAGSALPTGVTVAGQQQFVVALNAANPSKDVQFLIQAGDNASGISVAKAEVMTGAGAAAKTDESPLIIVVAQ